MCRTDWKDLDYYVTMCRDDGRIAYLVGPLPTLTEALHMVSRARERATAIQPWYHFCAFGTAALPKKPSNPVGVLNGDALQAVENGRTLE